MGPDEGQRILKMNFLHSLVKILAEKLSPGVRWVPGDEIER